MTQHLDRARRRLLQRSGTLAGWTAVRSLAVGTGLELPELANAADSAGGVHLDLPFANGGRELRTFPEKRPLIVLTARPPQLETPFEIFDQGLLTPNDAFFVRYHLADIPTRVDPESWRLKVSGSVENPLSLSLADLAQRFPTVELVAVNQCSGNGRGFFSPRVNGGQLGNGAMGNARWKGVPLKAVLDAAGVRASAVQVTFDGLDRPVLDDAADFVKALAIDHARDGEVLLAWEMNGEPLPMLNGYPLRLVVPGYYGTYWVKHLSEIRVIDREFEGYWMKSAYRIPDNDCRCVAPGTQPKGTLPINRLTIRSFITNLHEGSRVATGQPTTVRGIAFDSGHIIDEVAFSADGGRSWNPARLGQDLGRYSFRPWEVSFTPAAPGSHELLVRARNRAGEIQPDTASWNGPGYMRNVIERIRVEAA